jgi:MOSC domain-containing protein
MFISHSLSLPLRPEKARTRHLHWVSTGRVDIRQPAAIEPAWRPTYELHVGKGPQKRKSLLHNFVTGGDQLRNPLNNAMPSSPISEIVGLYRYPVKGLTPEPLEVVALSAGKTLPADRRYAIENGPSGFNVGTPCWITKSAFFMLMRDERLAELRSRFNDDTNLLTICRHGEVAVHADLETAEGRAAVEDFFMQYFGRHARGRPKVLAAPGHSFSDVARKVVSIINVATLRSIEQMVGAPVHPLRFRANLYVEGWPAWHELDLVGRTLAVGKARLKVVKRITRCAATNVDPETGARDLNIPQALIRQLGHAECGIYADVIAPGPISVGQTIAVE